MVTVTILQGKTIIILVIKVKLRIIIRHLAIFVSLKIWFSTGFGKSPPIEMDVLCSTHQISAAVYYIPI